MKFGVDSRADTPYPAYHRGLDFLGYRGMPLKENPESWH